MPLTCIAIDDEPLSLQLVRGYISAIPELKLQGLFDDALSAAKHLEQHPVDLLFIDINMPDITGVAFVRSLQSRPMVIFITAYREFAYDGFELEAVDYLLKPVDFSRFEKAVNKALEYHAFKSAQELLVPQVLFVRSGYNLVKVNLKDIEYLESVEDYVKIHLTADKPVMTLSSLKAIVAKLPPDMFMRVHRSYVVSISKMRSVLNKKIQLSTTQVPVSDSYLDAVRALVRK